MSEEKMTDPTSKDSRSSDSYMVHHKHESSQSICAPSKKGSHQPCAGERNLDCRKKASKCLTNPPCGPVSKANKIQWCNRETVCDDYGAGIKPKGYAGDHGGVFCCTPLTTYQKIHGALAKQLLTKELCIPRDINAPPPCGICEEMIPLCRGYYRKYDCVKPEEYGMMEFKHGKKQLRSKVDRYWTPCKSQKETHHRANLATHDMGLMCRLVKEKRGKPCW